ncbi:MAG TPA: polysaccharide deacetylase family protein [Candidatus Acidoferrales bacterium]|nr:polysaccharide deacetylase family protein [Candidatus Acidoferrales bacterium]
MNPWATAGAVVFGGAAVGAWGAVHPQSQLFGPTLRVTHDSSTLALTFDDGPNPAATPALLDLLHAHSVRATFFLIGSHVRAFPALAREIAARGHAIGNHTETHPSLIFLPRARLREELNRCREALLSAVGGAELRWMRPPFGFRGPQLHAVVRQLGYSGVAMWSKWAWDWKPQPAQPVIHRLRRVTGGDIVLLHDGDHRVLEGERRHTIAALEHWLPRWKDAGLRFVTLDAIGNAAPMNSRAAAADEKT